LLIIGVEDFKSQNWIERILKLISNQNLEKLYFYFSLNPIYLNHLFALEFLN